MVIYKATNTLDGKVYIGQTIRGLQDRIKEHRSDSVSDRHGMPFHRAIRKHGFDNFIWEVLCECSDLEKLNALETHYIELYDCLAPKGYNLCEGGKNGGKRVFTEEHIENMRKAQQARDKSSWKPHTEETKQKIRDAHIGKKRDPFSDEWKEKMSRARTGERNGMYGKTHSDETKRLLGEQKRGKILPPRTEAFKDKLRKKYIVTTPEGEEVMVTNMVEFCKQRDMYQSGMYSVANGKAKSYRKYRCKHYIELNKGGF